MAAVDKVVMPSREDVNTLHDKMNSLVNDYIEGKTNSLTTAERKFLRSELAHFTEKIFSHLQACTVYEDELRKQQPVEVQMEPLDEEMERQLEVTAERVQQVLDRVKRLREEVPEMCTSSLKKSFALAERDINAQEEVAAVSVVPKDHQSLADFTQSLVDSETRCQDVANVARKLADKLPSQTARAQNITRVLKDRALRKENIGVTESPTKETRGRLVRQLRHAPY